MPSSTRKIEIYAMLGVLSLLWGFAFVGIKEVVEEISPSTLTILRFAIADVCLIVIMAFAPATRPRFEKRDWWRVAVLAITGVPMYHLSLNWGEQRTSASVASLIVATAPVMVALLSAAILRERTPARRWIGIALAFGVAFWAWQGSEAGSQYLAGYLLERSLSLDNIFVFAVILAYFAVPGEKVQGKVLAWGIMLALGLRLIFILLGAALLDAFHITFYAFGALLLYTAWKLARHDDTEIEPEHNPLLKQLRKRVTITSDYHGEKLFTKLDGKRVATPLLAVFVVIASTDLVFAVDSIPAIFAVTQEPFIVFAANAFALIGLRALYFLLVGLMDRFVYLTQGLSFILAFIGLKMLLIDIWHVPIWLSLAVIAGTLAVTAVVSLRAEPKKGAAA
jgi:tellurite resistance protein TerC